MVMIMIEDAAATIRAAGMMQGPMVLAMAVLGQIAVGQRQAVCQAQNDSHQTTTARNLRAMAEKKMRPQKGLNCRMMSSKPLY